MTTESQPVQPGLTEREERFLARLNQKYEKETTAALVRSYLIAALVLLLLFAASRGIPWWGAALLVVEGIGLTLFHQYKRFARFKSRILAALWRERVGRAKA